MSKMAPLVGRDITERYFLPRFELLCSDPLFHVRKVSNSTVLSPILTQLEKRKLIFQVTDLLGGDLDGESLQHLTQVYNMIHVV